MKESPCYRAGTSIVDITPPLSIPYLSLSPRHCNFRGIHDRLYARSTVISDGRNEIVIINVDSIGFANTLLGEDRNFTQELREKIKKTTGIPLNHIMITSAHIHSTPDTVNFRPLIEEPGARDWLETIMSKISESIGKAKDSMFKALMKCGKGHVEGISVNRRGDNILDTEMIVILFESLESEEYVLLINYACHPVIVQVQNMISADYPGILQSTIEKVLKGKGKCLFLQGACGDINPIVNDSRSFDDVYSTGLSLSGEAIRIYGMMGFKDYPVQPVMIKTENIQVSLPSRQLPSLEERQNIVNEWNRKKHGNFFNEDEKNKLARLEEVYFRLKENIDCYDAEVQVFRIGNCIFIGVSGEMFCEMGLSIKNMAYPLIGIPVGFANGYVGYIATPSGWEKGGYEVQLGMWSKVGCESYEIICNNIKKLVSSIK